MISYDNLERFHSNNRDSVILLVESSEVANANQEGTVEELSFDGNIYTTTESAESVIMDWLNNN